MKNRIISSFITWLPFSVVIVITYGILYVAVQQYIRQSTDEPLVQQIIDAKDKLASGDAPAHITGALPAVNMSKSLTTFVVLYDAEGKPLYSSVSLHGNIPAPPTGVLTSALSSGENRLTWQPEPSARSAIVVQPCTIAGRPGYILAGRSLREVEHREAFLRTQIAVGIIITLITSFAAIFFVQITKNTSNKISFHPA